MAEEQTIATTLDEFVITAPRVKKPEGFNTTFTAPRTPNRRRFLDYLRYAEIPRFWSSKWDDGTFDEPSYLTFKLEFGGWGMSVSDGAMNIGTGDNAVRLDDTFSSIKKSDYDDYPLGLLDTHWNISWDGQTLDQWMYKNSYYNAVNWLIARNEDTRAEYLKAFIRGLLHVQAHTPWVFKTISGADKLLEFEPGRGSRLPVEGAEIQVTCQEDLQMTMKTLLTLYRKAAWDDVWQRWILPENMRQFKLILYISECRLFHYPNANYKDNGTVVDWLSSIYLGSSPVADNALAALEGYERDPNNTWGTSVLPVFAFECSPCEIKINNFFNNNFDNSPQNAEETTFSIIVKNVKFYERNDVLDNIRANFINELDNSYKRTTVQGNYGDNFLREWLNRGYFTGESVVMNDRFMVHNYIADRTAMRASLNSAYVTEWSSDDPIGAVVNFWTGVYNKIKNKIKGGNIETPMVSLNFEQSILDMVKHRGEITNTMSNSALNVTEEEKKLKEQFQDDMETNALNISENYDNAKKMMEQYIKMLRKKLKDNTELYDKVTDFLEEWENYQRVQRGGMPYLDDKGYIPEMPEMTELDISTNYIPVQDMTPVNPTLDIPKQELVSLDLTTVIPDMEMAELDTESETPEMDMALLNPSLEIPEQELTELNPSLEIPEQTLVELDTNSEIRDMEFVELDFGENIPDMEFVEMNPAMELPEQELTELNPSMELPEQELTELNPEIKLPEMDMVLLDPSMELPEQDMVELDLTAKLPEQEFVELKPEQELPEQSMVKLRPKQDIPPMTMTELLPNADVPEMDMTQLEPSSELPEQVMVEIGVGRETLNTQGMVGIDVSAELPENIPMTSVNDKPYEGDVMSMTGIEDKGTPEPPEISMVSVEEGDDYNPEIKPVILEGKDYKTEQELIMLKVPEEKNPDMAMVHLNTSVNLPKNTDMAYLKADEYVRPDMPMADLRNASVGKNTSINAPVLVDNLNSPNRKIRGGEMEPEDDFKPQMDMQVSELHDEYMVPQEMVEAFNERYQSPQMEMVSQSLDTHNVRQLMVERYYDTGEKGDTIMTELAPNTEERAEMNMTKVEQDTPGVTDMTMTSIADIQIPHEEMKMTGLDNTPGYVKSMDMISPDINIPEREGMKMTGLDNTAPIRDRMPMTDIVAEPVKKENKIENIGFIAPNSGGMNHMTAVNTDIAYHKPAIQPTVLIEPESKKSNYMVEVETPEPQEKNAPVDVGMDDTDYAVDKMNMTVVETPDTSVKGITDVSMLKTTGHRKPEIINTPIADTSYIRELIQTDLIKQDVTQVTFQKLIDVVETYEKANIDMVKIIDETRSSVPPEMTRIIDNEIINRNVSSGYIDVSQNDDAKDKKPVDNGVVIPGNKSKAIDRLTNKGKKKQSGGTIL